MSVAAVTVASVGNTFTSLNIPASRTWEVQELLSWQKHVPKRNIRCGMCSNRAAVMTGIFRVFLVNFVTLQAKYFWHGKFGILCMAILHLLYKAFSRNLNWVIEPEVEINLCKHTKGQFPICYALIHRLFLQEKSGTLQCLDGIVFLFPAECSRY